MGISDGECGVWQASTGLGQGVKSMIILKTAQNFPKWTTEFFTKNSPVANELCDQWLSIHEIKLYDLKFKELLI